MMGAFHDISRVAETDPCQVRDLASKLLETAWNLSPGKRKPKSTAIHPVVPGGSRIEQVGMVEVEMVACVIWAMAMVSRQYSTVLLHTCAITLPWYWIADHCVFAGRLTVFYVKYQEIGTPNYDCLITPLSFPAPESPMPQSAYGGEHTNSAMLELCFTHPVDWQCISDAQRVEALLLTNPAFQHLAVETSQWQVWRKCKDKNSQVLRKLLRLCELYLQLQIWFQMCNQMKIIKLNLFPLHECPDLWVSQEWNSCRHLHLLLQGQVTSSSDFTSEGPQKRQNEQ